MGRTFISRLKGLDAYARTLDEYSVRTTGGGIITLATAGSVFALLAFEFWAYRTVEVHPVLTVDRVRTRDLAINLNISFPNVPCFSLSVDTVDQAGEERTAVSEGIRKGRLDRNGNFIGETGQVRPESQITCGDCYKGDPAFSGCCNGCEDVEKCAKKGGKPGGLHAGSSPEAEEGCNIAGRLRLKKVAGNFHFAPGVPSSRDGKHVHNLDDDDGGGMRRRNFNLSHDIHTLSFGEPTTPAGSASETNPLEGISRITYAPNYIYQYYIRVVGVQSRRHDGSVTQTYQYSVTRYEKPNLLGGVEQIPGFFVTYDISPLVILYSDYRRPLSYFLTGCLSIIGGLFTIAGLFDSAVYSAERSLARKIELGKST